MAITADRFTSGKQFEEFLREVRDQARPVKGELERRITLDLSYYAGKQWARPARYFEDRAAGLTRLRTDHSPEARQLRVSTNRVAWLVQKSAVATFPDRIDAECLPPERDQGIESAFLAQTCEHALGAMMDAAGYHDARMDANFQRAVWGSYGIGFSVARAQRRLSVDGQDLDLPDATVQAFTFFPTDLTLDPDNLARRLDHHEFVVYSKARTANWINRRLGPDALKGVRADDLRTMGDLARFEHACNEITDGQLFAQYRSHSRTKGAMVHQVHVKDETGRFGLMYVAVELGGDQGVRVLNLDDPRTPFGGDGLPLALLHAHRRTDGPWGLSDAAMLKDDQDKLNLLDTLTYRTLQAYSHHKWAVDRNTIGRETTEEAFRSQFTNQVGGPIFWTSGTRDRPGQAPQLLMPPPPPPVLNDLSRQREEAMTRLSHRAEVSFGAVKSHVPDKSFKEAIEQADQVLGARVREDVLTDARMLTVLLGTTVGLVRRASPGVLATLRRARLTPEDLAALASADPAAPPVRVQVRESSVRYRSQNAKRQDLINALSMGAITPEQFRSAMASGDIDTPVSSDDRFYAQEAERAALRVARGEEWEPFPLGEHTYLFLNAFRKAMLETRKVRTDASPARQRLVRAIESQMMVLAQERAMDAAAQNVGGPAGGAGAQTPGQQVPQEQSVMDILATIEGAPDAGAMVA